MGQLHGLQDAIADHGGTETGPQPQKQHLAALVASERLHGSIVARTLTRCLNAASKSNPTQPRPRLCGSANGRFRTYRFRGSQWTSRHTASPLASFRDSGDHLLRRHAPGPDGNLRGSSCPVARILTFVPPISITSTFMMKSPLNKIRVSEARNPKRMRVGCLEGSWFQVSGFRFQVSETSYRLNPEL